MCDHRYEIGNVILDFPAWIEDRDGERFLTQAMISEGKPVPGIVKGIVRILPVGARIRIEEVLE